MEISDTRFRVEFEGHALSMEIAANGTVDGQWIDPETPTAIVTTHTAANFDHGAIPFPFAGQWSFESPMQGDNTFVSTDLVADTFSGAGTDISGAPKLFPDPKGATTAKRILTRASSFGDLGGKWIFDNKGPQCVAEFEQNTATWTCPKGEFGGTAFVTFTKTTASGQASSGVQYSGLKR